MWTLELTEHPDMTERWTLRQNGRIHANFTPRNVRYDTMTILWVMSEQGGEITLAFGDFKTRIATYHRGRKLAQVGRQRAAIRQRRLTDPAKRSR